MSDWDRALRSNQGKPVQVTILRDKKQQTLTLQVDSKRKTGALEMEELFPAGDCALTAELDADALKAFAETQRKRGGEGAEGPDSGDRPGLRSARSRLSSCARRRTRCATS